MEIIINKKTYVLKNVNNSRRNFFATHILPSYNYQKENFDKFISDIQKELAEKHKINQSIEQVKFNFFKELSKNLNRSVWTFLKDEDKKEIGVESNLNIEKEELIKFIEWVCSKIKAYSDYVSGKSNDKTKEDSEAIYSFLSKSFGWTFDQIKEMDELELLKAVEQAIELKKREQVENINSAALAGAYAGGSKKAKTEIDKLNRNLSNKEGMKKLIRENPNLEMKNELTREQLKAIMESGN